MIDDLTLKARIMAANQDELQKILPGGRKRPGWMPGSDKRRMGADNYNKLNEQQTIAQQGMQAAQKTQSQNQAVEDYRTKTANKPGVPYAATYQETKTGQQVGPTPTPAQAYERSARQQGDLEMGLGSNGTPTPDNSETKVKTTNGPDGTSKVEQITTHSNDEVPENTEQGGGNPEGQQIAGPITGPHKANEGSLGLPQNQGDPRLNEKTNESMALFEGVQARKKERLASEQTPITNQPSPAIPGSPPATIPLPAGSPAPPATIPLPAGSPATPPPPPNMAAPLPTQQPTTMTGGDTNSLGGGQQMNPVFNIGAGGQGQQQQGQAAPQNDPKTNAKNMQVANATERANTKGGIGTGVMSNLLTGGLAGAARLGFNAYQRGQGKKELAQLAKSPYSKVLSVFEIRKGISARNTTEVLRRGRI
jgi:hypothetical protein